MKPISSNRSMAINSVDCSVICLVRLATSIKKLVRQSQIVQSVMQDYQHDLSHLLPVCSRPKNNLQLLFVKTVRVIVVIYVEFRSF